MGECATVEFVGIREGHRIIAATPFDLEQMERLRQGGRGIRFVGTYPRSLQHQRWYRALISVVAGGIGWQPNGLHKEIKFRAQLVEQIFLHKGGASVELTSTAFGELDEPDFRAYTDLAIEIIFRDFLPGTERTPVFARVCEMVGPRPD